MSGRRDGHEAPVKPAIPGVNVVSTQKAWTSVRDGDAIFKYVTRFRFSGCASPKSFNPHAAKRLHGGTQATRSVSPPATGQSAHDRLALRRVSRQNRLMFRQHPEVQDSTGHRRNCWIIALLKPDARKRAASLAIKFNI